MIVSRSDPTGRLRIRNRQPARPDGIVAATFAAGLARA
jgi:hypothetical protein